MAGAMIDTPRVRRRGAVKHQLGAAGERRKRVAPVEVAGDAAQAVRSEFRGLALRAHQRLHLVARSKRRQRPPRDIAATDNEQSLHTTILTRPRRP